MKINDKILSVPPYISTSWSNIGALHFDNSSLLVTLKSGSTINIPKLDADIIEKIFSAHETFLEKEAPSQKGMPSFPFPTEGLEFGNIMQHNQKLSHSPDLPPEAIGRIKEMINGVDFAASGMEMPTAEPHCNCPYCQIARVMNTLHEEEEEEVLDEELTFREYKWIIDKENDNLYIVTSPSNKDEEYRVFLGDPIGCTCGSNNCEHIRTVLGS